VLSIFDFECFRIVENLGSFPEADSVLREILNRFLIIPLESQIKFLFVILGSHFRNCEPHELKNAAHRYLTTSFRTYNSRSTPGRSE
jgi:hypothetical protein